MKTIALDFDGTIADNRQARIHATFDLFGIRVKENETTKATSPLSPEQYGQMTTLAGTREYMKKYYSFYPGARKAIFALHEAGFRIVVFSGRPQEIFDDMVEWLAGLPIDEFFATNWQSKEKLALTIKPDVIVEDTLYKLLDMKSCGARLLYLRTPVNAGEDAVEGVEEVKSWEEVVTSVVRNLKE